MSRLFPILRPVPALPRAPVRGGHRAAQMTAIKRRSPWHS